MTRIDRTRRPGVALFAGKTNPNDLPRLQLLDPIAAVPELEMEGFMHGHVRTRRRWEFIVDIGP